ncbi:MAG: glycosyltransferase [Anaerolineales bacterium]|nr:glycosyltransferase [Anaerolineales bacterium]
MRILFLTQIVPYPPDAGPKIKTWNVLRYLAAQGHDIILASFVRAEEVQFVPILEQVCKVVHTVPIKRSRLADIGYGLRSQLTKRPFLIERDDLQGMHRVVGELMKSGQIDCIHADQLTMTQYALPYAGRKPDTVDPVNANNATLTPFNVATQVNQRPILVFDAHNAVWTIVERMRQNLPLFLRPVAGLEARRVKRYEGMLVGAFDHILAVTEIDRIDLLEAASEVDGRGQDEKIIASLFAPVTVIPIAVDTEQIQPVSRQPGSKTILTLGTLHYPPNADGVRWFLREVFPIVRKSIPEASLTIVGKNPPDDLIDSARENPEWVTVTGYVPDLRPYLRSSALVVIPVRAGSGMRVRILDSFAYGMPVVTTSVGLEGIDAIPGEQVLVSDAEPDFAENVINLLQDEDLQAKLSFNGRRLVEERYDWKAALKSLDNIYGELDEHMAE